MRQPKSPAEYLDVRRFVVAIFGGGISAYDPEADFYSAPDTMTYLALFERGQVISAASILIVDGVANVWSAGTAEAARGRGAASVVVHACLVEAHRQGACAATLGTSRDLAREGGLYHRLGFETVGHERGWTLRNIDRMELLALHHAGQERQSSASVRARGNGTSRFGDRWVQRRSWSGASAR